MGGEFGVWAIPLEAAIRVRGEGDCKLQIADCGLRIDTATADEGHLCGSIRNSQSAIRNRAEPSETGTNEPNGAEIEGQRL